MYVCRTSNLICMLNFVQISSIVNGLWTVNEIQNGGRRHLEFIIFVNFVHRAYFKWQPATLLQYFIYQRQSAAELLLFMQKFKMAAAAILNDNFVMLDHSRSPFVHLKFPSKFRVHRMRSFWDIVIQKFCKFGLKCLFRPPIKHVFGQFWPQTLFFYHWDPQKALPYVETRVLSHKRSWSVFWCDL